MFCCLMLLGGCSKGSKETVTNMKISVDDVTEFYYTYENINFNASYLRYRFYRESDKYTFSFEKREKPGEYGPTNEEDVTGSGAVELKKEEWNKFLSLIKDGSVGKREDSAEAGDSGPWTFIYWKKDKGKYQVFDFSSYDKRAQFEEFCLELSEQSDRIEETSASSGEGKTETEMKDFNLVRVRFSPGYGDMLGGYHSSSLEKDENGNWVFICRDREEHSSPTTVSVYAVSDEKAAEFEDFISKNKVTSLEKRLKSDLFATDYSPWSWTFDYETTSFGKVKRDDCRLEEYRRYSKKDMELLSELREKFNGLRGDKISETVEED